MAYETLEQRRTRESHENGETLAVIMDLAHELAHSPELVEVEHRDRRSTLVHVRNDITPFTFENATERVRQPRIQVTMDYKGISGSSLISKAAEHGYHVTDIWQTDRCREDKQVEFALQ